jgi:hypothetical protein
MDGPAGPVPGPERLDAELRRLVRRDAVLSDAGRGGLFDMRPDRDRRRKVIRQVPADIVDFWRAAGLVEPDGAGGFVATDAAAARVRRREAAPGIDPFRAQHDDFGTRDLVDADGDPTPRRANLTESPLAWFARRGGAGEGFFSQRELAAGELLRADHVAAGRDPRLTSDWNAAPASGAARGGRDPSAASDRAIAARRRVRGALDHVGAGLAGALEAVCVEGRGLDEVERGYGWPRRSGKVVLKIALGRLADFYRLP